MKKKVLSLILVIALIASVCTVLAACSDSEKKTDAADAASSAPADNAGDSGASAGIDQPDDNGGEAVIDSASSDAAADAPAATSAPYNGATVLSEDDAIAEVLHQMEFDWTYTAEYKGAIKIPDGSVWHNVEVYDEDGALEGSYYVSDTTSTIKTTSELEAYAYR